MDDTGICSLPGIAAVCSSAQQTGDAVAAAPFQWLAQQISALAASVYTGLWGVIDQTTLVSLSSPTYLRVYDLMFGIAVVVALGLALLQLIAGVLRKDPRALTTAAAGLGRAVLGGFALVTIVGSLLAVTDALSVGIVQATGTSIDQLGARVTALIGALPLAASAGAGGAAILTILLGTIALAGAFLVLASLLVRKALLLIAIVLGPLALAGQGWQATRGWLTKWAMFILALVLSKLVVVITFLIGVNAIGAPLQPTLASFTNPIAGVVIVLIAAFAPYMTYKLIGFLGIDMYHSMSVEQEAKQAVDRPIPLPRALPLNATSVLSGRSGTAPSADAPTGAVATAAPTALVVTEAAKAAKTVTTAGPRLGNATAETAEEHTEQATDPAQPGTPAPDRGTQPQPVFHPAPEPQPAVGDPPPAPPGPQVPAGRDPRST